MASGSFGSQCPSCSKHFSNDSLVLRHMNNPRTSCKSWPRFFESTHPEPPNRSMNEHLAPSNDRASNNDNHPIQDDHNGTGDRRTETVERYEDTHPNISSVLGSGPGFMDRFNLDRYAEKRTENLYHPFSSKVEWGLASWLSCSGLSMRAIDQFLALPIVSTSIRIMPTSLIGPQDSATFTLLHNRKNITHTHGQPSGSS